jgi:hypothetical protein
MKEIKAQGYVKQLQNGTAQEQTQRVYDLIYSVEGYDLKRLSLTLKYTYSQLMPILKKLKNIGVVYVTNKDASFDVPRYAIETREVIILLVRKKIHGIKLQKWIDKGVKLGIDFEIKGL